jgi:hypothetical protein
MTAFLGKELVRPKFSVARLGVLNSGAEGVSSVLGYDVM